ncbi:MAG: hypothetical protein ACYCQL_00235 [Acidithiobacillus sp.]
MLQRLGKQRQEQKEALFIMGGLRLSFVSQKTVMIVEGLIV